MNPFVPPNVDLRDFAFMPIDVHRLLTSETWVLGTGDERSAAMTLWLVSWHQVPAGSLPESDRMLSHLSQAKAWLKVKAHALRGWQLADDSRLYHPIVAEKVLEAWLEKLAQRLSSGAGNAKRWNVEFDAKPIEEEMQISRSLLSALNPQSRTLSKKRTSGIPSGSKNTPVRNPEVIPQGIPSGSQETETETETGILKEKTLPSGDGGSGKPAKSEHGLLTAKTAEAIVAAYHAKLPMLPGVRAMSEPRKRKLKSRWTESPEHQSVAYWEQFFAYVAQSDFLTGRDNRWTGCDFEWLIESSNHLKVTEGKYENREAV